MDPLEGLRVAVVAARKAEDSAAQALESARGQADLTSATAQGLVRVLGFHEAVSDLIAARAKSLAAAEALFAAAVEIREATERLLNEFERRQGSA